MTGKFARLGIVIGKERNSMPRKLRLSEADLRRIVRKLIIETYEARGDADNEENLLVEPDDPDNDENQNEINTIAAWWYQGCDNSFRDRAHLSRR